MMKIILVHGKKRSGKDHFSKLLKQELESRGFTCKIYAFADAFKDILCRTLDISLEDLNDWKNQKAILGVTDNNGYQKLIDFRELHQKFGDDAMKKWFGKYVWANIVYNQIYIEPGKLDFAIVSDFRVMEEYDENSITIKIKNDSTDLNNTDNHRTENGLLDFNFDYIIDNTNKPDLTDQIIPLVNELVLSNP